MGELDNNRSFSGISRDFGGLVYIEKLFLFTCMQTCMPGTGVREMGIGLVQ